MMLGFSSLLTEQSISSIAEEYGFTDKASVEKFIMDFEIHYHISRHIKCVTRGGMCMPFHISEGTNRLSIDIDLLTSSTTNEIRHAMSQIDGSVDELTCEEYIPVNPYPLDNLITYRIYYDSCLGKQNFVKVDCFCDVKIQIDSQQVKSGSPLFVFNTKHDMNILSRGALIGDKLTTLAVGTIGLKSARKSNAAKQIYDLGALLKDATVQDLQTSFDTFERMTDFKVRCFGYDPRYTTSDVVDSIADFVFGLLNLKGAVSITREQTKRYNGFQGTYLRSKHGYKKVSHVTDVLLIFLYSRQLCKYLNGDASKDEAVRSIHAVIKRMHEMDEYDAELVQSIRKSCREHLPESCGFNRKILNGALLEHVFLIDQIFQD